LDFVATLHACRIVGALRAAVERPLVLVALGIALALERVSRGCCARGAARDVEQGQGEQQRKQESHACILVPAWPPVEPYAIGRGALAAGARSGG
jgi:hypothetical protein